MLRSTIEGVVSPTTRSGPPPRAPSRAEILAALSVAIDLGLGQPAEHMLRAALIGTRIADRLGLESDQRDCVYYATLVMWIGCHADSHEFAQWFGDDIAVRRDSYLIDWSGLPYYRFLANNIGRGEPLLQRMTTIATLFVNARGNMSRLIHSHCTSAALLAERMGLGASVQHAVGFSFERHDGSGLPSGARRRRDPDRDAGGSAGRHGRGSPPPRWSGGRGGHGDRPQRQALRPHRRRRLRRRCRRDPGRSVNPAIPGTRHCAPLPTTTTHSTNSPSTNYSSPSATSWI